MFHLFAFSEVIANTANIDIDAVQEGIMTVMNTHLLLPTDMQLVAASAFSATLSRARIVAPSLRQVGIPYIRPIFQAVIPPQDPNLQDLTKFPLRLRANEEIAIQATSGVAMTERFTALLWLMDRYEPIPPGDVYTLYGTSTTAAVANTWTQLAITWNDQLPNGTYVVIGSEIQSTNAQAHRWIFNNQYLRPGFMSVSGLGNRSAPLSYDGRLGILGRFTTVTLPRAEVLVNGTDAAHDVYLQAIKVA